MTATPEPTAAPLPLEIRANRTMWWRMLFISAALVLGCLALLVFQEPEDSLWKLPAGPRAAILVFGILFFGAGIVLAILNIRRTGPDFVIDAEGIIDNSIASHAGRIPWSEIRSLTYRHGRREPFISVDLHDPQAILSKISPRRVAVAKGNIKLGGSPVNILLRRTEPDAATILATLNAVAPGLLREPPR